MTKQVRHQQSAASNKLCGTKPLAVRLDLWPYDLLADFMSKSLSASRAYALLHSKMGLGVGLTQSRTATCFCTASKLLKAGTVNKATQLI